MTFISRKFFAAAALSLAVSAIAMAPVANAAMMKKNDHKMEMKCKAKHGMMMHGKCEMMKKKK
jgi:uncharacterized low-complexity protein